MKVLLDVTYIQLIAHLMCAGSYESHIWESQAGTVCHLDYNELKVPVLQILRDEGPLDSNAIGRILFQSKQISIDIHALRMALMRYHRQGIVKRTRSGGSFKYDISERGIGRLRWLESLKSAEE